MAAKSRHSLRPRWVNVVELGCSVLRSRSGTSVSIGKEIWRISMASEILQAVATIGFVENRS